MWHKIYSKLIEIRPTEVLKRTLTNKLNTKIFSSHYDANIQHAKHSFSAYGYEKAGNDAFNPSYIDFDNSTY